MTALEFLRSIEWSLGIGQCPACAGRNPDIEGEKLRSTPGHAGGCPLLEAIHIVDRHEFPEEE